MAKRPNAPNPDAPRSWRGTAGPLHFATQCTDAEAWAWLQSDDPWPPGRARVLSDAEVVR